MALIGGTTPLAETVEALNAPHDQRRRHQREYPAGQSVGRDRDLCGAVGGYEVVRG